MAQITGNVAAGIGGMMLGLGANAVGQLVHLWGVNDPNTLTDNSIISAATGSLFSRLDGSTSTSLYVKTALPNTWTAK